MLVRLPEPISIGSLHRQFTLALGQINEPDTLVDSFTSSSKDVCPGTLFVACRGIGSDGHSFIENAFAAGAAAVAATDVGKLGERPGFESANTRMLLSRLSSFAYQHPSRAMRVIGITGTNGKTTSNWMLYHALKNLGEACVRIGTLGYELSNGQGDTDTLTTPSPETIHQILAKARDAGCTNAVLEVSSHALHQHRVDDVAWDAAVFTNITHDHLDYHRTFEEYLKAKRKIFELLRSSNKTNRIICSNLETPEGRTIASDFARSFQDNVSFGYGAGAPVQIKSFDQGRTSSKLVLAMKGEDALIETCFLGKHNAENLAGTYGILRGFGYSLQDCVLALSNIPSVPGRLEPFEKRGIATFVDYAHSPDALERVTVCLKDIPHRRLLLVFGCGGDRDWRKRPAMGNIAARLADYVVVSSDNPRTENPQLIIDDILQSDLVVGSRCAVIVDRAEAIRHVLSQAQEGDLVLIAGKGHESYQIIGTEKRYFSDQDEIRKFFAQ